MQEVVDAYFSVCWCIYPGSQHWAPLLFFPIYSLICARPPPLPHLAPTACFDLLSFCRSAYIMSFPNQWSALVFFVFFLHWQNISLG